MDEDTLASPEVLNSLSQALSNLLLGDNEIRSAAERLLTERWLATQPEQVILALAQLTRTAPDENMRSFAAVLLRRLAFRPVPPDNSQHHNSIPNSSHIGGPHHPHSQHFQTIYDHLSEPTRHRTERTLLLCLQSEPIDAVRRKVADAVTDLALGSLERARPWTELQNWTFEASQSSSASLREVSFRIMGAVPALVLDQDTGVVLRVMQGGLKDSESVQVRHAALKASEAYLTAADTHTRVQAVGLMHPMLESLVPLSHTDLAQFLRTLTPLTTAQPILFRAHLDSLLSFLVPLVLSSSPSQQADLSEATPTVGNPNPNVRIGGGHGGGAFGFPSTPTAANPHGHVLNGAGGGGAGGSNTRFLFPPPPNVLSPTSNANANANVSHGLPSSLHSSNRAPPLNNPNNLNNNTSRVPTPEDEARDEMRRAALEFLISLSESRPAMVKECHGWVNGVVRCCLEGMSEIRDEGGEASVRWGECDDPNDDDDEFGYPRVFDESLDRLACAVGGKALLPVAFMYIPALIASHDWMQRHAGLLAIAAIAEGTRQVMERELDRVVSLITPTFGDPHPRVKWAACQCVGQLCTDLEEVVQSRYHKQIFSVLIPTLSAPEPRVHAHAAAAVINFCAGVDGDTLQPYLESIVQGLLQMLQTNSKRYVQEQAITTLAMVADAAADTFRQFYHIIMPNLVNVLRTATDPELRTLRCKVMECAGIIAVAVGREVFEADAREFSDLLLQIQQSLNRSDDEITAQYLMSTWAKVCQTVGPSFEPYLQHIMPLVLHSAAVRADVTVVDSEGGKAPERDGWEVIEMQGQRVEIRTASLEEKCTAFDVLLVLCTVMGPAFRPYLSSSLSLALPALKFFFHDGVRETSALLIPALVVGAKNAEMINADLVSAVFTPIIEGLQSEMDSGFLASLYKCFADCLRSLGGREILGLASPPAQPDMNPVSDANGQPRSQLESAFVKATQNQLHTLATRRQNRAGRIHGLDWAEEQEDMVLMEEMEGFALDEMQKALEVVDPNDSLLVAISHVREMAIPHGYEDEEFE